MGQRSAAQTTVLSCCARAWGQHQLTCMCGPLQTQCSNCAWQPENQPRCSITDDEASHLCISCFGHAAALNLSTVSDDFCLCLSTTAQALPSLVLLCGCEPDVKQIHGGYMGSIPAF